MVQFGVETEGLEKVEIMEDAYGWFAWRRFLRQALPGVFFLFAVSSGAVGQEVSISEFSIPTSLSPSHITAGPDGNLWFTAGAAGINRVCRITPSGSITEFPFEGTLGQYALTDIANGPDGNLWFVGGENNRIGRITPAGIVTYFAIPTTLTSPGASVGSITAGPDGNLWFTTSTSSPDHTTTIVLGRITPHGSITKFVFPRQTTGCIAADITSGPDRNLWFTVACYDDAGPSGGSIGRITSDGSATEFPLSRTNTPGDITTGADGNLWFTFRNSGIGRITPSGSMTEFPLLGVRPVGITAGNDGNLWFGDFDGKVGRITPRGMATYYPIPASAILKITTGDDGSLWFTEPSLADRQIGRLRLLTPNPTYTLTRTPPLTNTPTATTVTPTSVVPTPSATQTPSDSSVGRASFEFSGGEQAWIVPEGVTSIQVDVRGAEGGANLVDRSVFGGKGGQVQTTLSITPL